ncbi:SDR family NAD(P)-dependent oxidoreductase [bacterium]|nr:SDR family NAD(P)-dependent oxidoreductase [bacterium]
MISKVYVITGSASGIGRGVLEKLAENNIVFAGYRNPSHKDVLAAISANVYPFYVDYTKPETIKLASDYIKSKCTKIDTLINIAGCVVAGPVEKIEISEIKRQFDVNVFGHLEFTQNLIELLWGGRIINVSSMASYGIFPFISPYCASKKCLDMFFNSFLIENKKNIKVISIKPGVISTPLWEKSIEENSKYFEKFDEYSKEMKYVLENAKANETGGLSTDKVVKVILKADRARNPKLTYTVGTDALFARLISKLPQKIVNNLVKFGIRTRMK